MLHTPRSIQLCTCSQGEEGKLEDTSIWQWAVHMPIHKKVLFATAPECNQTLELDPDQMGNFHQYPFPSAAPPLCSSPCPLSPKFSISWRSMACSGVQKQEKNVALMQNLAWIKPLISCGSAQPAQTQALETQVLNMSLQRVSSTVVASCQDV